jgi:hypothetical protein
MRGESGRQSFRLELEACPDNASRRRWLPGPRARHESNGNRPTAIGG